MLKLNTTSKNWINGVDSLRFVLALLVLLSHLDNPITIFLQKKSTESIDIPLALSKSVFNGVAAVIAFFIISGFAIHHSAKNNKMNWQKFVLRRYIRILLPLAIVVLLGFKFNHPEKAVIWSLICELIYYTLYPILRISVSNWVRATKISFLVSCGLIVSLGWNDLMAFVNQTNYNFHGHYWQFGPYCTWLIGLPCWLMGILIAEKVHELKPVTFRSLVLLRLVILFVSMGLNFMKLEFHLSYLLSMNIFAILLFIWIKAEISYYISRPANRLLEWSGRFSYSLYIVHPIAIIVLKSLIDVNSITYFLIIIFTIVLSYIYYLVIEKPSHKFATQI